MSKKTTFMSYRELYIQINLIYNYTTTVYNTEIGGEKNEE